MQTKLVTVLKVVCPARGKLERTGSESVLAGDSRIGVRLGFADHLVSVGFFSVVENNDLFLVRVV